MARGRWGWSPHIEGSRKLIEAEPDSSKKEKHELQQRIDVAKAAPGLAHLILRGPSPVCQLCGGTDAPIIAGQHLNPERWCS